MYILPQYNTDTCQITKNHEKLKIEMMQKYRKKQKCEKIFFFAIGNDMKFSGARGRSAAISGCMRKPVHKN